MSNPADPPSTLIKMLLDHFIPDPLIIKTKPLQIPAVCSVLHKQYESCMTYPENVCVLEYEKLIKCSLTHK